MTSLFSLPFLVLFIYLFIVFAGVCPAQMQSNSVTAPADQINNLENQLFFRQYADENVSARLARIENYIFGQQYDDSTENRIARIQASVATNKNPGGGAMQSPPTQNPGDQMPVQSNNIPAAGRPSNDDDIDAQNRQLQAQQARANQVNTLLSQAVSLYRQKQFKEAIDLFEQVIRLDPQNASAHFSLGIAMEANGNLENAAAEYSQAAAIDPDNKDYQLATQNIKNKIDQVNNTKSENNKWQFLAAEAAEALKNGQFDQALTMYTQLTEKDPHQALYQYNLGTTYLMLKRPEEALPHYKSAHKLDPANKIYDESLQKLELSLKEAKEKEAKDKEAKEKIAKQTNQKKIDLLKTFGLEVKSSRDGVEVKKVTPGLRAATVGLYPRDIIKAVDGQGINKIAELEQILGSKPMGQRFQMVLIRNRITCQLFF